MSDEICGTVQDKLPLVAHGRAAWTAGEAAHLASCADCAAEREVVERATRLGAGAAARLDTAKLAAGVLGEIGRRRRQDRWRRNAGMIGLAAAAVLVVAVALRTPQRPQLAQRPDSVAPVTVAAGVLTLPLAELDSLDVGQLQAVLDGLDSPVGEATPGEAPSFGDLDDSQLERVLRSLEG